jgi:hypothetical protein
MMSKASVWIIDFFTADLIFKGSNIALQSHLKSMISNGSLRYCSIEKKSFGSKPELKLAFVDHKHCCEQICADIAANANALISQKFSKKWSRIDSSAQFIAATANCKGYGAISSREGSFLTLSDLATPLKFPHLTIAQVCRSCKIPHHP